MIGTACSLVKTEGMEWGYGMKAVSGKRTVVPKYLPALVTA